MYSERVSMVRLILELLKLNKLWDLVIRLYNHDLEREHNPLLHALVASPEHGAPPFLGAGLLHVLV